MRKGRRKNEGCRVTGDGTEKPVPSARRRDCIFAVDYLIIPTGMVVIGYRTYSQSQTVSMVLVPGTGTGTSTFLYRCGTSDLSVALRAFLLHRPSNQMLTIIPTQSIHPSGPLNQLTWFVRPPAATSLFRCDRRTLESYRRSSMLE
jgi:hypothetical protein